MNNTSIVIEVENGKIINVYGSDKDIDVTILVDATDEQVEELDGDFVMQHPYILYNA